MEQKCGKKDADDYDNDSSQNYEFSDYDIIENENEQNEADLENEYEIYPKESIFKRTDTERNLCVELKNNNKVYIKYEENWTVEDLIKRVVKTKEIKKIYSSSENYNFNSLTTIAFFDMHLILLRNIKSELDTKIDLNMKLKTFHDMGLLKSPKYPLFLLKDNKGRSTNNFKNIDKLFLEDLIENYDEMDMLPNENDLIFFYQNYLPRACPMYTLKYSEVFININKGL